MKRSSKLGFIILLALSMNAEAGSRSPCDGVDRSLSKSEATQFAGPVAK